MQNRSSKKLFVRLIMLSLILSACQPPPSKKNSAAPTAKISTVSEKAANCEQQIRAQMNNQTISFLSFDGLNEQINEANSIIKKPLSEPTFQASESQNKITSLSISFASSSSKGWVSLGYTLEQAPKDSNALLLLSASFSIVTENEKKVELIETMQIDSSCQMKLSKILTSTLQISKDGRGELSETTYFSDGGKRPKSAKFTLPENGILTNTSENISDEQGIKMIDRLYFFRPVLG